MIDVTGKKVKVWRYEKDGRVNYSTSVGNKLQDGSYDNAFIPLQFKGIPDIPKGTEIEIKKGFISFYRNRENQPVFKLVVMEYELGENGFYPAEEIDESSLPF